MRLAEFMTLFVRPDAVTEALPHVQPRRTIRALFINDTARNGGPGRSLHSILKFLDPGTVHRTVVLPREGAIADLLVRDAAADEIRFLPSLVENPVEPWSRPIERADFAAPVAIKAARLLGNVAKAGRAITELAGVVGGGEYDIVYCNGTNADFIGGALARLTRVPALWHVRYTSLPSPVRGLHRRLSSSSGVRRILCVSRAAASLFSHCMEKVRVIHNALDLSEFDPARVRPLLRGELGISSKALVFGSHGRVLRRKGYVEMIRAARIALDRLTPTDRANVFFVVVGDTPEDFRVDHVAECRALISNLGLQAQFTMLGFRPDVRSWVADFDVAVVPSVYPDPLPRAVIESMALSKPVIAYDVGGVAEMLDPCTGRLVALGEPHGDGASDEAVERLADAIVGYARDGGLRERQASAARTHVESHFDARLHAKRVQDEIVLASGLMTSTGAVARA